MSMFEDKELKFNGETYTIPADQIVQVISIVEEHISYNDLVFFNEKPKVAALAMAMADVLKYLRCPMPRAEIIEKVYAARFSVPGNSVDFNELVGFSLELQFLMIPPEVVRAKMEELQKLQEEADKEKKSKEASRPQEAEGTTE